MKYDVFISYSRRDYMDGMMRPDPSSVVARLLNSLEENGISYWIDKKGISGSDEFAEVIATNIRVSRIFLFVSSEASNSSIWTAGEIGTARMMKKPILPFRIDDTPYHDKVIVYLAPLSFIDYHHDAPNPFEELISSLNIKLDELDPDRKRVRELQSQLSGLNDEIKRKDKERRDIVADLAKLGVEAHVEGFVDDKKLKELQSALAAKDKELAELEDRLGRERKEAKKEMAMLEDRFKREQKNAEAEKDKELAELKGRFEYEQQKTKYELAELKNRFEREQKNAESEKRNANDTIVKLKAEIGDLKTKVIPQLQADADKYRTMKAEADRCERERQEAERKRREEERCRAEEAERLRCSNTLWWDEASQSLRYKDFSYPFVRVDGGTFMMGATKEQGADAYDDEKPAHSVTLSTYCIGKTAVPQWLWQAVMGYNGSRFKGNHLPVENVSWINCQTFVRKVNSLTKKNFTLPTEAQWEFAARGGNKSKGYKYSGSNSLDEVAWYKDNNGGKTHDVGTKKPNELGLYDMSGNVWEWCEDWYGIYSYSAQTNPAGPTSGTDRVRRGGGWDRRARGCRVSSRHSLRPLDSNDYLGLRLALRP